MERHIHRQMVLRLLGVGAQGPLLDMGRYPVSFPLVWPWRQGPFWPWKNIQ